MANDREFKDEDTSLDPEDVNSAPTNIASGASSPDPNDVVPVPPAMSAAEIDERGRIVDELREGADSSEQRKRDDDSEMR